MGLRWPPLLLVVALLAWIAALALAWPGNYGMNHTAGTVAALADAALHGEAPGHDNGTSFVASVYFPPVPLIVAALHRMGLDWRGALRVMSLLSALALLAAVVVAAGALGGGADAVALAAALLMVSFPFKAASLAGRADLLAAAFSLGALAAWLRDPKLRGWGAPTLAALGWLTKASSFAFPLAVAWWAWRDARLDAWLRFTVRFALIVLAGLVLTLPWHGPTWMADALRTLIWAPPNSWVLFRGPAELLRYLGSFAEMAALAAFTIVLLSGGERWDARVRSFFFVTLAVTLLVLANRGSDHNHLVELAALSATLGGVWAEQRLSRGGPLVAALLPLVVFAASWRDLQNLGRQTRGSQERRSKVVAELQEPKGPVLSEDPLLTLAAGRRPALTDPAALRSLAAKKDKRALRLIQRVQDGEFDLVVLNEDPRARASWYRDFHLGPKMKEAIVEHYRRSGTADGYFLYRTGKWWRLIR